MPLKAQQIVKPQRPLTAFFSTLLFCFLCLSSATVHAAGLVGKATVNGKAIAGITVQAFPATSLTLGGTAPHRTGPTTQDGLFRLELPPGEYYLLADSDALFSYYGRNPVTVPVEGLEGINLLMVPRNGPRPQAQSRVDNGVMGLVTRDGKPVAGAVTFVYPDLSSRLKGFGMGMAAPTDENGIFEVPLPAGSYYLLVRLRKDGVQAGPMRAGDLFGYLPGNPLTLGEKEVARVHIPLIEVPEKVERFAATMFGNTSISGRIVDQEGKPVAGMSAMLYDDMMMLNRPAFVSQPSDAEGRFVLSFPHGGTYYLAARKTLGGTPQPGELYGRFGGTPEAAVKIRTGEKLEGITVVVEPVW